MDTKDQVKVQLLCVPDCPLVQKVRHTIRDCLAKTQIPVTVEELIGAYNSPTVLVNGFDVTGQPPAEEGQTSCRLDLPNEEQILAAILVLSALSFEVAIAPETRTGAFKALLQSGERVWADSLSIEIGWETARVLERLLALQQVGLVQLDEDSCIVGACGLSLLPTTHEMSIQGRKFWAWCAFDVLGIFGALHASGFARSTDPSTNDEIVLNFDRGLPQDTNLTICIADPVPGLSIQERWCCNVNFFKSRSAAEAWMAKNSVRGSLFLVENAVAVAREIWSRCGARKGLI